MPFCKISFKTQKPETKPYPKQLKTLGDHLRKRRLDLNLQQKEVALQIGVTECSIWNWESNESAPALRFLPAVIAFLGYSPLPEGETLIEQFKALRKSLGLTHELAAAQLGVDESTIAHWEQGTTRPVGPYRKLLERFVDTGGRFESKRSEGPTFSPSLLYTVRQRMGLNRAALARKLGISSHTLLRWERGDRRPTGIYKRLVEDMLRTSV